MTELLRTQRRWRPLVFMSTTIQNGLGSQSKQSYYFCARFWLTAMRYIAEIELSKKASNSINMQNSTLKSHIHFLNQ